MQMTHDNDCEWRIGFDCTCAPKPSAIDVAEARAVVKPLVWRFFDVDHQFGKGVYDANAIRYTYTILDCGAKPEVGPRFYVESISASFADLAAAQAAAQADYEARILSALHPAAEDRVTDYDTAIAYATFFAMTLREQLYPANTAWQPLGDLTGLLTQIDNMVAGALHPASPLSAVAMREKAAALFTIPEAKPVADRIRAIPTTCTHAKLLAAAAELAEVRALVSAATPYASPVNNADFGRAVLQYDALVAALAPFARKAGV